VRATSAIALVLPGVLFCGIAFRKRDRAVFGVLLSVGFLAFAIAAVTGCSAYNGSQMTPQPAAQPFSVTVTSGAVSHTTQLTLQVQ
jgi:hypothetical protein